MAPLSHVEAVHIAAFFDARAETDHADLAFVFATRLRAPAYVAAEAFRAGLVPNVALTDAINRVTGVHEADLYLAILLEQGVPHQVHRHRKPVDKHRRKRCVRRTKAR